MKLIHYICGIVFLFSLLGHSENKYVSGLSIQQLTGQLDQLLREKEVFVAHKEFRIDSLKQALNRCSILEEQYALSMLILDEYRSYLCDSALKYVDKNWEIACRTGNKDWQNETQLHRANLLLTVGLYWEAMEILNSVDTNSFSLKLLRQYYHCSEQIYDHMANYAQQLSGDVYKRKSRLYTDSLLLVTPPDGCEYMRILARKLYNEGQIVEAERVLLEALGQYSFGSHNYAVITATLGKMQSSGDKKKKYLLVSAISDIMSAVKENTSLRNLAVELYAEGDIDRAYRYCNAAMEDANFYNARLRSLEIGRIHPIIEAAYKAEIQHSHRRLQFCLMVIGVLFIILALFFYFLYRWNRKLNRMKNELQQANEGLRGLNAESQKLNVSLSEANKVKEEYIGRFMSLCAAYISNMKNYQSQVYGKIMTNKLGELKQMLNSDEIVEEEVRQFYRNFDEAFLNIYPNYVTEFNRLLREEEYIVLSHDRCLTPELRIFALMRLGVTDTERIAKFLQYSTNTVYTYRTRMRNKARNKVEFDKKIQIL